MLNWTQISNSLKKEEVKIGGIEGTEKTVKTLCFPQHEKLVHRKRNKDHHR